MKAIVDFLLVGQGLAGTLLSFGLINEGKTVFVIDDPTRTKATQVAAGLINPVVFRRMTKSWLVDQAFPESEATYRKLEVLLGSSLYFPIEIRKPLNKEQRSIWEAKFHSNDLQRYLEPAPTEEPATDPNLSGNCWGKVKNAARVDLQKLNRLYADYLDRHQLIRHESFDYTQLRIEKELVSYRDIRSRKIIFCEGASVSQNPFFQDVQFKHSKGEVIEMSIPGLNLNHIISDQVFIMPVGADSYKVGATYEWNELNDQTTSAARAELLEKIYKIVDQPGIITGQWAGVRPTTHDRKPVMGLLPHQPQIGLFNGLGPKGALLGPLLAKQFAAYLSGSPDEIQPETDLRRYIR